MTQWMLTTFWFSLPVFPSLQMPDNTNNGAGGKEQRKFGRYTYGSVCCYVTYGSYDLYPQCQYVIA